MKKIGIIGEGKMGTNLFQYISGFGYEMHWLVSPYADPEKISRQWQKKVIRNLNAGLYSKEEADLRAGALIGNDPEILKACNLIIEALPEREELKAEQFLTLDRIVNPGCIFASNSSSILPGVLAPSPERAPRTIGMHFFYPVNLKNIAELIITPETSAETTQQAVEFLDSVGRKYLLQHEHDAFLLNRVYLEVQREAWNIVSEGVMTPRQVDDLVRDRLFPLGPFACMDIVGMEVMAPSIKNYSGRNTDPGRYGLLLAELERLTGLGRTGMKAGRGFFDYSDAVEDAQPMEPIPTEPVLSAVAARLKSALDHAVNMFGTGVAYTREEIHAGLREYLGE